MCQTLKSSMKEVHYDILHTTCLPTHEGKGKESVTFCDTHKYVHAHLKPHCVCVCVCVLAQTHANRLT